MDISYICQISIVAIIEIFTSPIKFKSSYIVTLLADITNHTVDKLYRFVRKFSYWQFSTVKTKHTYKQRIRSIEYLEFLL